MSLAAGGRLALDADLRASPELLSAGLGLESVAPRLGALLSGLARIRLTVGGLLSLLTGGTVRAESALLSLPALCLSRPLLAWAALLPWALLASPNGTCPRLVGARRMMVSAGRYKGGREIAPHVFAPNLINVAGVLGDGWIEAGEEAQQVAQVPPEVPLRLGILCCRYHLREIDDHRTVGPQQNVELREVAVDQVGGEDLDDFRTELQVQRLRSPL